MSQRLHGVIRLGVRVDRRLFACRAHRVAHRRGGHHRLKGTVSPPKHERFFAAHRNCVATEAGGVACLRGPHPDVCHRHLTVEKRSAAVHARVGDDSPGHHHGRGVGAYLPRPAGRDRGRRAPRALSESTSGTNRPLGPGAVRSDLLSQPPQAMVRTNAGTPSISGSVGNTGFPPERERSGVRRRSAAAPDPCGRRIAGWPARPPGSGASKGARSRCAIERFGAMLAACLRRRASRRHYRGGRVRSATDAYRQACPYFANRRKCETPHTLEPRGTRPKPKTSEKEEIYPKGLRRWP